MDRGIAALLRLMGQLEMVIDSLPPGAFTRAPASVTGGSIGGHVRHCLDHIEALLGAVSTGTLDYDRRRRGTRDEREPQAALERLRVLGDRLLALPPITLRWRVKVRSMTSAEEAPAEMDSTLARELAYVTSHTTHHNAIIALLAVEAGGLVPRHFGYAPSTIAAIRESPCAR